VTGLSASPRCWLLVVAVGLLLGGAVPGLLPVGGLLLVARRHEGSCCCCCCCCCCLLLLLVLGLPLFLPAGLLAADLLAEALLLVASPAPLGE
jgi:hypothetical protein